MAPVVGARAADEVYSLRLPDRCASRAARACRGLDRLASAGREEDSRVVHRRETRDPLGQVERGPVREILEDRVGLELAQLGARRRRRSPAGRGRRSRTRGSPCRRGSGGPRSSQSQTPSPRSITTSAPSNDRHVGERMPEPRRAHGVSRTPCVAHATLGAAAQVRAVRLDAACKMARDRAYCSRARCRGGGLAWRTRVAVDVGGTFTDICVMDEASGTVEVAKVPSTADPIDGVLTGVEEAGVDLRDVVLFCHGTTVATNALITRRLPPAAMVTTQGVSRRDRDPSRHEGRPLGRLQGRRSALHPDAATASRSRSGRLRRQGRRRRWTRRRRVASPAFSAGAASRPWRSASSTPTRTRPTSCGCARSWRRSCPASRCRPPPRSCRRSSSTSASRPRSRTPCSRPSSAGYVGAAREQARGGRVRRRPPAAALGRRRDDAAGRRSASPCGSPPRASRPAPSRAAISPASAATRTRSGSTWAGRAPTSRSSTTAQARMTKEWFVEYGYPICFPSIEVLTIGAGGGSLAWIDEAGSLRNGPQSAGADPGPGVLRARQHASRRTPTRTSCSDGSARS